MSRRRFSERQVLECLVRQGAIIPCKRCRVAFTVEDARMAEREHLHELKLGGEDSVENCAYSHGNCHSVVTNGTLVTSAGSSKQRIAKTRENHTAKFKIEKVPLDAGLNRPFGKCRRCGQYEDDCQCSKREPLSPLAGRRRRERHRI